MVPIRASRAAVCSSVLSNRGVSGRIRSSRVNRRSRLLCAAAFTAARTSAHTFGTTVDVNYDVAHGAG